MVNNFQLPTTITHAGTVGVLSESRLKLNIFGALNFESPKSTLLLVAIAETSLKSEFIRDTSAGAVAGNDVSVHRWCVATRGIRSKVRTSQSVDLPSRS